jgi:hypothetical protein
VQPSPPPPDPGSALAGARPPPLPPAEFDDLPNSAALSDALNRPALIVARAVEWGTVLIGFEQATKYTVYDEAGNVRCFHCALLCVVACVFVRRVCGGERLCMCFKDVVGIGTQMEPRSITSPTTKVVALMAEDTTSFANAMARQLLRTRRPFQTTVLSPEGEVLFRVRRPFYLVSSSMEVLDAEGRPIGAVKQRWHPFKRLYDL